MEIQTSSLSSLISEIKLSDRIFKDFPNKESSSPNLFTYGLIHSISYFSLNNTIPIGISNKATSPTFSIRDYNVDIYLSVSLNNIFSLRKL